MYVTAPASLRSLYAHKGLQRICRADDIIMHLSVSLVKREQWMLAECPDNALFKIK